MSLFVMQFVYLFITIALDLDKEKYDKKFFLTYFRNKEQLLKFKNLVVQDIPESILIIKQNLTQPLFVNNSFEKLIESPQLEGIRTKLSKFILNESLEDSPQYSNAAFKERKTLLTFLESTLFQQSSAGKFSCNLTYKKRGIEKEDGSSQENIEHMFEAKAIHLLWDNEPAIAVILHDITQQHTILSLKIADAHKDTILATVSHELRTPLNGILGMVQIIEKRTQDSQMLHFLGICKNSANLLLSLVNSILDLNQIRANKLKLYLSKTNLRELLGNIVSLFEFQCNEKGLQLKLKIGPTCPTYITTDKNRLSQIFINLVGNALKFTRSGGITISAVARLGSEDMVLSVEDTGSGIKEEDKKKLFQVFGKLEQSDNSVNPHGVGLGLTISDKLAKLLGNRGIDVESVYGKGSKFTFSIKKLLRDESEAREIEPGDAGTDLPKMISDEKVDVQNKMLNYSRQFVKESPKSRILFPKVNSFINPSEQSSSDIQIQRTYNSSILLRNITSQSLSRINFGGNMNSYVLIVDDNPMNTVIAECLITSHGYKAKTALYGQVAIDMILNCNYSTEPIKLVLMDCQMPVMDGFMVTKILKKMMVEKRIPEIPIVALTANDSDADKEASKRAGMCEHITKPLKEIELVRILNKYMIK